MARDHARVNVAIWGSADFRSLSPRAQHLYFALITSPTLNYVGVADWRPKRLAALAAGWEEEALVDASRELSEANVVVIDDFTEEILVRTWMKHDGLLNQKRLAVSIANAYAAVSSTLLRGAIVHELRKLKTTNPALESWSHEKLVQVLEEPEIGPEGTSEELPLGPSTTTDLGQTELPFGPNQTSPTTATTPSTISSSKATATKADSRKRSPRTPSPEQQHINEVAKAAYEAIGKAANFMAIRGIASWCVKDRGLSLEQFRDACVAIYEAGKPITKQVIGQHLDGYLAGGSTNRTSQRQQDQLRILDNLGSLDEQKSANNKLEAG